MSIEPETTEGIILRATPFQDFHRILTVFTEGLGLIKVFAQHVNHSSSMKNQFLQPFCRIELITSKGKSDLYYYKDGSLIENYYAKCTPDLAPQFLSGAAALAQSILTSQFLGKPAPKLFLLLDMYLKGMALTIAMHNLISSFQLKLLAHEGLLSALAQCCSCGAELSSLWLGNGGEFFCKEHSPTHSIFLKETEALQLFFLAKSRKLQEIVTCPLDLQLSWKIHQFFEQAVQS